MVKMKKIDFSWLKEMRQNTSMVDWILWVLIATFCFLFYQHVDIFHTGSSAVTYLNGHILDFYDWNAANFQYDAYMPTTYILFAIWDIPIRLLGWLTVPTMDPTTPVRIWFKLGTTLIYCLTALYIYKIVALKTNDKRRAYFAAFLFVANPIAMYSEFCFGQYDVFTAFFMVLGLYYYLKNDTKRFVLFFAIAITCKYFALLLFVPILVLKEKEVKKIILQLIGGVSLFALEVLVYYPTEGFRTGVFGFGASNYVFEANIGISFGNKISLVVMGWLVLCAVAYLIKVENDQLFSYSIFLTDIALFLAFGMTFFHPQWVLMATPFIALTVGMNKHQDVLLLMIAIAAFAYYGFIFLAWAGGVDNNLFNYGTFRDLFQGRPAKGMCLNWFYTRTMASSDSMSQTSLYYTIFSSMLLIFAIFGHPKNWVAYNGKVEETKYNYILAGICSLGVIVMLFIVPTWITVYHDFNIEYEVMSLANNSTDATEPMEMESYFEEVFAFNGTKMTAFSVKMAFAEDGDRIGKVHFTISDYETGKVLGTAEINKDCINHYAKTRIDLDQPIETEPGHLYTLTVTDDSSEESPRVALFYAHDENKEDGWAIFNGEEQAADLELSVVGL